MDQIEAELKSLHKDVTLGNCETHIDQIVAKLEQAKARISGEQEQREDSTVVMRQLEAQLEQERKKILEAEKTVYRAINHYGKTLEKVFKTENLNRVIERIRIDGVSDDLNRAILMHLARSGDFDVASVFMEEADVQVPEDLLNEFAHMYEILQYIIGSNLEPAIKWAKDKRQELTNRGSNLEFTLHKLQYSRILFDSTKDESQKISDAVMYARQNLYQFQDRYLTEIARLMCATLYVNKPYGLSPYEELITKPTIQQLSAMFASEFCSLLGLTPESPLYLAVTAGSLALPVLAKVEKALKSQKAEWSQKGELPATINLPQRFHYHAIFVCPVSKEQTTEENPPMLIPCGHILARESLRSIAKNGADHSFKCPYCPNDTTYAEAKRVYF